MDFITFCIEYRTFIASQTFLLERDVVLNRVDALMLLLIHLLSVPVNSAMVNVLVL